MTNFFITLFRLKMHMILFLDSLLDVVCTYYCVARVTCLVAIKHGDPKTLSMRHACSEHLCSADPTLI